MAKLSSTNEERRACTNPCTRYIPEDSAEFKNFRQEQSKRGIRGTHNPGRSRRNSSDQDHRNPSRTQPIVLNCRGRPKPIYAHSAVTVTRPKLKFQLRP